MKALVCVALLPSEFVTVTSTVSCALVGPNGVVAVIVVALTMLTFVAATPPNVTVAPLWKFEPLIVTAVPPEVLPVFGDTLVIESVGSTYV